MSTKDILDKHRKRKTLTADSDMKALSNLLVSGMIKPFIDDLVEETMKKMTEVIKKIEIDTQKELKDTKKEIIEEISDAKEVLRQKDLDIKELTKQEISNIKSDVSDDIGGVRKEFRNVFANFKDKVANRIKDISLTPGEKGEKGEQGSPDKPVEIATKLNTLTEKIEPKVIKGFDRIIGNLGKNIQDTKRIAGGGGGGGMGNWVTEAPSGTPNGTLTSFTLTSDVSSNGKAIILLYNGQVLEHTTHFSISGKTITTTFAPETGTNLFAMYVRT